MIVIGDYVKLYDYTLNEVVTYLIVESHTEIRYVNMASRTKKYTRSYTVSDANGFDSISDQSLLGKNLLGKSLGSDVSFTSPDGNQQKYRVIGLSDDNEYWDTCPASDDNKDVSITTKLNKNIKSVSGKSKNKRTTVNTQNIDQQKTAYHTVEIILDLEQFDTDLTYGRFILNDLTVNRSKDYGTVPLAYKWEVAQIYLLHLALSRFIKPCNLVIYLYHCKEIYSITRDHPLEYDIVQTYDPHTEVIISDIIDKLKEYPHKFKIQ